MLFATALGAVGAAYGFFDAGCPEYEAFGTGSGAAS